MPAGLCVVMALPPLSGRGPAHPVASSATAKPTHRNRAKYPTASGLPASHNQWNLSLFGDDAGGVWIAWEDFRNSSNFQIWLNHLNGKGTSAWVGGEMPVAPADGDQGRIAITGDKKDGVWLAWIDNRLSTVGLYVQEVDQTGRPLQGMVGRRVADRLNKPSKPQLVALSPGKVLVAWVDRPRKDRWTLSWALIGAQK